MPGPYGENKRSTGNFREAAEGGKTPPYDVNR